MTFIYWYLHPTIYIWCLLVLKSFSSTSFTIMFNSLFQFLHCRCVCQCLQVLNAYAPCLSCAILWFFCELQVSVSLFTELLGAQVEHLLMYYARQEWLVWWKESRAWILKLSTWTELIWAPYFRLIVQCPYSFCGCYGLHSSFSILLLEILVFGIGDMDIDYFPFLDLTLLRSEG